jgi:hypothetical protein
VPHTAQKRPLPKPQKKEGYGIFQQQDTMTTATKQAKPQRVTISPDYPITLLVLGAIDAAAISARHGSALDLDWLRTTGALWFEAIGRDGNRILQLADAIAQGKQRNSPARHTRQWKRTAAPTMQEAC